METAPFQGIAEELKLLILSHCGAPELAALSRTTRAYHAPAEATLYSTISMHFGRAQSFGCLQTLALNEDKAKLVRSLAITLPNDQEFDIKRVREIRRQYNVPETFSKYLVAACRNVQDIAFFSIRLADECRTAVIDNAIRIALESLFNRPVVKRPMLRTAIGFSAFWVWAVIATGWTKNQCIRRK
ncbi:hypothetical protein DFP72DRAFT_919961 [Ephemerocybe angulata]|uniref:F-box domain-containing protein n=1 Tax=Ephemerocybe angulata TaxID=980116 RepID=A0A8H6LYB4_9AGAR|nr:hypothetical protein DFP72DRAFT_919961 [Tulosesus angulatus]